MYYSPSSVKAVTGAHNIFRNETTQSRFNLVDKKGHMSIYLDIFYEETISLIDRERMT